MDIKINPLKRHTPSRPESRNTEAKKALEEDSFQPSAKEAGFLGGFKDLARRALNGLARPSLPTYKENQTPYEAKITRFDFRDETRDRNIPITVYYPENKEDLDRSPVVVMSHGLAGNSVTYRYFGRHLASHGYTVLQPNHEGSDTKAFVLKPSLDIVSDAARLFSQAELLDRGRDLSFCLDKLEAGSFGKEIGEKIDLENVALAGHSFGALTAQAMAGVAVRDSEGKEIPVEDERFDAFIAMSPYGDSLPTHLLGMDPETYSRMDKPFLSLSGDLDSLFTGREGPEVHLDPFHGAGSPNKYHVVIGNTFHASFAQVFGLLGPTKDMTCSTSLAFLDANLKNDAEGASYLADDLQKVARTHNSIALVSTDCA
jgi:alpha-beta hydrolase superfamily lysophospholipase